MSPVLLKNSKTCPASASAPDAPSSFDGAPGDAALEAADFAALVDTHCPIPRGLPIAVAVSGGADSMALALLAREWTQASGRHLRTVTVDHRLRADSAAEAEQVGAWLAARGIAHDILAWTGDKPTHGIQEAARAARYRLIAEWARANAIGHVLLAHHLDDQAETVLMRLARGSGITGLAGMRGVSLRDGIRLCRPLLSVPKARLRASVRAAGQDWVEDPSNESARFTRTGYRRLIGRLAARGVGSDRIAALAHAFARLDASVDEASRRALGVLAVRMPDGALILPQTVYAALPEPIAARLLRDVLAEVGGRALAPRGDRLARAQARLCGGAEGAFTLGGCRLRVRRGEIRISIEKGRAGQRRNP